MAPVYLVGTGSTLNYYLKTLGKRISGLIVPLETIQGTTLLRIESINRGFQYRGAVTEKKKKKKKVVWQTTCTKRKNNRKCLYSKQICSICLKIPPTDRPPLRTDISLPQPTGYTGLPSNHLCIPRGKYFSPRLNDCFQMTKAVSREYHCVKSKSKRKK